MQNGKVLLVSAFQKEKGLVLKNTTISNATHGVFSNIAREIIKYDFSGTTFQSCDIAIYAKGVDQEHEFYYCKIKDCNFLNCITGIHLDKVRQINEISACTFHNCSGSGIYMSDDVQIIKLVQNNFQQSVLGINMFRTKGNILLNQVNHYTNCESAISIDEGSSFSIKNQNATHCGKGIEIKKLISAGIITIEDNLISANEIGIDITNSSPLFVIRRNIFSGYNISRSIGLRVKDSPYGSYTISNNQNISGYETGISLSNCYFRGLTLVANSFNCKNYGIQYYNNNYSGPSVNHTITTNYFSNKSKVYISSAKNLKISDNSHQMNILKGTICEITNSINPYFTNNYFIGNSSSPPLLEMLKLSNNAGTAMCCNNYDTNGKGLFIYGTNPESKVNVSTFNNGTFVLERSMIGENAHAGNRWKANTTGQLLNSDPFLNQFVVKLSQGTSTDGFMTPQFINPNNLAGDWFPNSNSDSTSFSCANNCGLIVMLNSPNHNPSYLPYNIPSDSSVTVGSCYPTALDMDGDGVCDGTDPDPTNACIPVANDTDGDGICNGIDPDPNNPCVPLYQDTDGDGLCDTNDPYPFDPCKPNGVDTDSDGICDSLDPNPTHNDPYIIPSGGPTGYNNSDGNGDPLQVEGYNQNGLAFSISDLETMADTPQGTTDYDYLNYVESMSYLYHVLHTSPYYRILSNKLSTKYLALQNGQVGAYYKVKGLTSTLNKPSNLMYKNTVRQELLLNRLRNLSSTLRGTTYQDSVHRVKLDSVYYTQAVLLQNIYKQHDSIKLINSNIIASHINNLSQTGKVFQAMYDYYQVYISYVLGKQPLTSSQISSLNLIANQCPLMYGEGVYKSREFLVSSELYSFEDFINDCSSPSPRNIDTQSEIPLIISCSPNPSTGQLTVTSTQDVSDVHVMNLYGRTVKTIKGPGGKNMILDLEDLTAGIYFIEVTTTIGQSVKHKIILIK